MIDAHCHLEQPEFDKDLNQVIARARAAGLKAVVTCCAHPNDFEKSLSIAQRFEGFVFLTAGIHPEFIKELPEQQIENFLKVLEQHMHKLVGIGEIGLDYFWIKEQHWRKAQAKLFERMLEFAQRHKKPIIVHCRQAHEDALEILESFSAKRVLLHLWSARKYLQKILDNGWYVSFGPIIERSKVHKKLARDLPLDKALLETDSPWFGPKTESGQLRGEPTRIKIPAQKIAEVKALDFETVWRACGENCIKFYNLKINNVYAEKIKK